MEREVDPSAPLSPAAQPGYGSNVQFDPNLMPATANPKQLSHLIEYFSKTVMALSTLDGSIADNVLKVQANGSNQLSNTQRLLIGSDLGHAQAVSLWLFGVAIWHPSIFISNFVQLPTVNEVVSQVPFKLTVRSDVFLQAYIAPYLALVRFELPKSYKVSYAASVVLLNYLYKKGRLNESRYKQLLSHQKTWYTLQNKRHLRTGRDWCIIFTSFLGAAAVLAVLTVLEHNAHGWTRRHTWLGVALGIFAAASLVAGCMLPRCKKKKWYGSVWSYRVASFLNEATYKPLLTRGLPDESEIAKVTAGRRCC